MTTDEIERLKQVWWDASEATDDHGWQCVGWCAVCQELTDAETDALERLKAARLAAHP